MSNVIGLFSSKTVNGNLNPDTAAVSFLFNIFYQLFGTEITNRRLLYYKDLSTNLFIHRHLPKILPALIGALADDSAETELELAEAVVLSVSDDDSDIGVSCIMEELSTASMFKRDDHNRPKNDEVIKLFKLV